MEKASRNPNWSRDELTLALNLYVQTGGNPVGKDDAALERLSAVLNKLHRLNGVTGRATLRNRNGVYLKVMNYRASDPTYLQQGKVGMTRGNRLEAVLWEEYKGRHKQLEADAKAIQQAVNNADEAAFAKPSSVNSYEAEEGGIILRLHRQYERDRKLVSEKKKDAKSAGPLSCEVCGFDFQEMYGELGADFIEVHHTKPIHTLKPGSKTKLEDLALLCANCHRMAHRRRVPLGLSELRAVRTKPIP